VTDVVMTPFNGFMTFRLWHSVEGNIWLLGKVCTNVQRSFRVLIIKLISQIYFWNRTLRVSDSFSVHHQESNTVYTAIHAPIAVCTVLDS
jgi:hypothetical protein